MDPIKDKDDVDSKVRTVSEIVGCGLDVARELLESHDGDVNRVVDTFCGLTRTDHTSSTGRSDIVDAGDMIEDVPVGISAVLKRKKNATTTIEENYEKFEFKERRDSLNNYLDEVRKVMSKDVMILEDCPNCAAPQILPDKTVDVFSCGDCGVTTSRMCFKEANGENVCGDEYEGGFEKITVLPSKKFDADNLLDQEYRIAEGQFLRMLGRRLEYEIKSIDIVKNEKLEKKFNEKKLEFKKRGIDDKSLLIFHGTPQENIGSILKNNFNLNKVAHGRMYGRGVYFSEKPEVSMGYTQDMSSLILCLVLPGDNSKEIKDDIFGGVFIDDPSPKAGAWAIVVPDVDQILPKYVINFTEASKAQSFGGVLGGLGLPPSIVANLLGPGTSLGPVFPMMPGQTSLGTTGPVTGQHHVQLGGNIGQHMQPGPSTTITLHGHQPHILQQIMQVMQGPPGAAAAQTGQVGDVRGEVPDQQENVANSGDDVGSKEMVEQDLYCAKCDVWVSTEEEMDKHMKGKTHLRKHVK